MSDIVVPDPRLHDIYRMRDLSGRLLYIGVTNGGLRRFMEHAKDKTWWREVAQIDVEHVHCSRPVIEAIEREAIRTERPLYNVTHNVGRVELPPPPPANPPTPAEVVELIKRLDEIGVPESASVRAVILALRESGSGARHTVIVSAQRYRSDRAERFAPVAKPAPPTTPQPHANDAIWVDDIVRHPAFGVGRVTYVDGDGEKRELEINFGDQVGTKYLAAKWAPLTIVKAAGAS